MTKTHKLEGPMLNALDALMPKSFLKAFPTQNILIKGSFHLKDTSFNVGKYLR